MIKKKIGILTFHWATNYGAILQAYAMQTYLKLLGHDVYIIDYKPAQFDNSIYNFFRHRKFLHLKEYIITNNKEKRLSLFRHDNLTLTERIEFKKDIPSLIGNFDLIITGSDQVFNPFFLQYGERQKEATTYFLNFDGNFKKIAYAVSFGCTVYPKKLIPLISTLIKSFDGISVREKSGKHIIKEAGRNDAVLVPDPTLLLDISEYLKFINHTHDDKIFVYMLHDKLSKLKTVLPFSFNIKYSENESIEEWLSNIKNASTIITNSFHCVVFALLFHRPLWVVLDTLENNNMNDRFFSLLERCNLIERIITFKDIPNIHDISIDWDYVDASLEDFRNIGKDFISKKIN